MTKNGMICGFYVNISALLLTVLTHRAIIEAYQRGGPEREEGPPVGKQRFDRMEE